jgi:hypothetical protein
MITALRRALAAATGVTFSLALSACMLEGGDSLVTPGGAEDFPNTVTALGRIAVGDLPTGAQLEQAGNVQLPEMPPLGGLDSLQVSLPQASAKRAALAKAFDEATPGAPDTLDLSLWQLDLSNSRYLEAYFFGRIYAYAYDSTATSVRRDTVVALYLGDRSGIDYSTLIARVQAEPGKYLMPLEYRGAIVATATGIRQSYRLRNNDSRGDLDAAEYAVTTPQNGGGTLRRGVKFYGPDGAFRSVTVPEEVEILRRGSANDTLEWTLARDADGDRRLWTSGDSGIVDVYLYVRNPASQPDLARMRSFVRADFRHTPTKDSLLQLAYQEQRWLRNGRITGFAFQSVVAGVPPAPGDTARMTVDTVFFEKDSMIKYSATYNLRAGSAPYRMQEHALLGFKVSKIWRRGAVFSVASVFTPDSARPLGAAFEGAMLSTAAYYNGDTVRTEGSITPDSLNLTVRQVKNGLATSYEVALDAAGNLLRPPVIVNADATATAKIAPRRAP